MKFYPPCLVQVKLVNLLECASKGNYLLLWCLTNTPVLHSHFHDNPFLYTPCVTHLYHLLCTAQPRGVHKYIPYILHIQFYVLEMGVHQNITPV